MLKCSKEAFAACPERKGYWCLEEAAFTEGSECHKFNLEIAQRPMTNADRIRAMSDEELAYWVMCSHGDVEPDSCPKGCMKCTLEWLKQPAEEVRSGA